MKYPKIGIRPTIDGRQGGVRESLEDKTMALAQAVANLISTNLKNGDGSPVECVIADSTIGRVAESAACAEKFEREGVGSTITVTSCWCYGSETMDMNPHYPKAVWGFNGTERPGAVYLAAVLAAHAQKGLPAFGIYGHDVQDLDDNTIPADVAEKILRFARAAQAVATMRGKSYLSMGNTCMGIAGSIVDADFFQDYLGMRTEYVDLVEILRRVDEGIYDPEEYKKAMAWTEKYCKANEGHDYNEEIGKAKTREQKDKDWEFTVKNMLIINDLMHGNPRLEELGFEGQVSTVMEERGGVYTSRVVGEPVQGMEKLRQLQGYCDGRFGVGNWVLERAYSDHYSDIPMLQAAQRAVVTDPDGVLKKVARVHGWAVVDWDPSKRFTRSKKRGERQAAKAHKQAIEASSAASGE